MAVNARGTGGPVIVNSSAAGRGGLVVLDRIISVDCLVGLDHIVAADSLVAADNFPASDGLVASDGRFMLVGPVAPIVTSALHAVFEWLRRAGEQLVDPLRRGDGPNEFRLSSAETATTTYDGSVGWGNRPPATLECPRCGGDIYQHTARDGIDCPRCVAEYDPGEFADLELRSLVCPVCRSGMRHGQRHPERFDFPEWATCDSCRYHWEFRHSY